MPQDRTPRPRGDAGAPGPRPPAEGVEFEKISGDIRVHRHLSARTKARKRALDVLFEAEAKRVDPIVVLDERCVLAQPPIREFTIELVRGVVAHAAEIDARIRTATAADWPLERLAGVDRNLARIAVYEIDHTDVPTEAIISEAVELADEFSTEDSAQFLNGLLAKVAESRGA